MSKSNITPPPTAEEQLNFLAKVQPLLGEGAFTASYKFALLLPIADLAVEKGEDNGDPLLLKLDSITEKFIYYYWGHTRPYGGVGADGSPVILRQNTKGQAAIISRLMEFQDDVGLKVSVAKRNGKDWANLVKRVRVIIEEMPLWRLQNVGNQTLDFLYPAQDEVTTADRIELRAGIGFCLRRFHSLVVDLVRGAWLAYVRRTNLEVLGSASDLEVFLFGNERLVLGKATGVLSDVQSGKCFYCTRDLTSDIDVDHFIPWAKYPVDRGHNVVLAHPACNRSKSDHIPAMDHLKRWGERNLAKGTEIASRLTESGLLCDLVASTQVTSWAYEVAERIGERGWYKGDDLRAITSQWRSYL